MQMLFMMGEYPEKHMLFTSSAGSKNTLENTSIYGHHYHKPGKTGLVLLFLLQSFNVIYSLDLAHQCCLCSHQICSIVANYSY